MDARDTLVSQAARARADALAMLLSDAWQAELPLAYLRQQAHYFVPASDPLRVESALRRGAAAAAPLLKRWGVSAAELGEKIGLDVRLVEHELASGRSAPVVVIDLEDTLPRGERATAVDTVVRALGSREAGPGHPLVFVRTPGIAASDAAETLVELVLRADSGNGLDGVVYPKIRHPSEARWLSDALAEAERTAGLEEGRVRVVLLIESGWAVVRLPEIATAVGRRLCALAFGAADFAADVGLPRMATDHAVARFARESIVVLAGALGVPAIDAMTLDYPTPDDRLSQSANRERIVDRLTLTYRDTVAARALGMSGKLSGHPLQLLVILLAFDAAARDTDLEAHAAHVEGYLSSLAEQRGVTVIDGQMADGATERHARTILRRAVATGWFDPQRAVRLGVIDRDELQALHR